MLLKIAKRYIPEYIKNKKLDDLFRLTGDAFQAEVPELRGLPFLERLKKYARFTRDQAERCFQWEGPTDERKKRIETVEGKLCENSFILGKDLRKSLHIKTWKQAAEALELVYRIIGIDFHYEGQGGFTVKGCFFSSYYNAEVCDLVSSLDKGLAAGISGGGTLSFTHRITEGCSCCKGCFVQENR